MISKGQAEIALQAENQALYGSMHRPLPLAFINLPASRCCSTGPGSVCSGLLQASTIWSTCSTSNPAKGLMTESLPKPLWHGSSPSTPRFVATLSKLQMLVCWSNDQDASVQQLLLAQMQSLTISTGRRPAPRPCLAWLRLMVALLGNAA